MVYVHDVNPIYHDVKYACISIECVTTTLYSITRIDAIKVELVFKKQTRNYSCKCALPARVKQCYKYLVEMSVFANIGRLRMTMRLKLQTIGILPLGFTVRACNKQRNMTYSSVRKNRVRRLEIYSHRSVRY